MADTEPAKKKRNKRFPSIKEFKTKDAYYDHMIALFTKKKADHANFKDDESKKRAKKAREFVVGVDELIKDPKYADIVAELRKKLEPITPDQGTITPPPSAPIPPPTVTAKAQGGRR